MTNKPSTLQERFTDRSRKVLELALREALQLGHNYVAPEHILLALMREGESLAARAIQDSGLDLRRRVLNLMRGTPEPPLTLEQRVAALEDVVYQVGSDE